MAKLLPVTKTVYEIHENATCDHCGVYIDNTERYSKPGYIFWCSECVKTDFELLYAVLKSIDSKFQFLPQTYYDYLHKEEKKHRYYWWMSGEYVAKIKAIPKGTKAKNPTYTGLMVRITEDSKHYCWHTPKESAEAIKPDPIIIFHSFVVNWSNGDRHYYLNGKLHRDGAPAIECADGNKYWYVDGKFIQPQEKELRQYNYRVRYIDTAKHR